jgi:hypothetical protein
MASNFRSTIIDMHLEDVMRIAISEMEPDVNYLEGQKQAQYLY